MHCEVQAKVSERRWQRGQAYVAGRWTDGAPADAPPLTVLDPASGTAIGTVPALGAAEAREAIEAAQVAFPAWRALLPRQRGDLLMAWHDLVLAESEALAALLTREQGKPLAEARGEIAYGASFLRWFAEEAQRAYGEVIPSHIPGRRMSVQLEPIGVVGMITPWNFPSAMLARKAAAALAAGCTAVAVPSPETPFSALALAALAEQAGIPPGVFSVLTGDPAVLAGVLCESPLVRGLSFTGSTEVGRLLLAQCAPTVKRMSLELGGHAPFIVFPDCDVEQAAAAAVEAKFQTSGQDCLAANRIYVHAAIAEAFIQAFARRAAALVVAPGDAPGAEIGPLIHDRAVNRVLAQIDDALRKGARLVTGGGRHALGGLFLQPTVLADVTPEMRIAQEETFGPLAAILPFETEAEVIAAANATEYGLAAYVWTRDLGTAHRMSDALAYGMVAVNTVRLTGAPIPFGGIKQSGLGREGSRHGLAEFLQPKYVCIAA